MYDFPRNKTGISGHLTTWTFEVSCMTYASGVSNAVWCCQIVRYRKFSTTRFDFTSRVYLVIASRSMRKLVYATSNTARLRSLQYVSMALRSGVAVGRKINSKQSFCRVFSRNLFQYRHADQAWVWSLNAPTAALLLNFGRQGALCGILKVVYPLSDIVFLSRLFVNNCLSWGWHLSGECLRRCL